MEYKVLTKEDRLCRHRFGHGHPDQHGHRTPGTPIHVVADGATSPRGSAT